MSKAPMTAADKQAVITQFEGLVAAEQRKGIPKIQASNRVAQRNPALHAKYLMSTNRNVLAQDIKENAADFGIGLD